MPEKWDNVMPFVLLSALEVKNTKGRVISAAFPRVLRCPVQELDVTRIYLKDFKGIFGPSDSGVRQADGVKPPRKDGKVV